MKNKYILSENVFVRLDLGKAFIYDGDNKQIYKIPLFYGMIMNEIRVEAKTFDEIHIKILSQVLGDKDFEQYVKKIQSCILKLIKYGFVVVVEC